MAHEIESFPSQTEGLISLIVTTNLKCLLEIFALNFKGKIDTFYYAIVLK